VKSPLRVLGLGGLGVWIGDMSGNLEENVGNGGVRGQHIQQRPQLGGAGTLEVLAMAMVKERPL